MSPRNASKQRFLLLKAIYEEAQGQPRKIVNVSDLGSKLGMSKDQVLAAYSYLYDRSLIDGRVSASYMAGITTTGIHEVEAAFESPERPTEYFSPHIINVVQARDITNAQFMVASPRSTQTLRAEDVDQISDIVADLETVGNFCDPHRKEELQDEINTIRSQLKRETPNTTILREALKEASKTVRSLAEGVGSSLAAPHIAAMVPALADRICSAIEHLG